MEQSEITSKIHIIRGRKVMFDSDLAVFYDVLTKNLNKAVSRNIARFPLDFMFQLTKKEFENLKFHFGTSSWGGKRFRTGSQDNNGFQPPDKLGT